MLGGAKNVDNDIMTIARLMGASKHDLLWKVTLPSALPWIFAGLSIALTYSLLGVIVAEILAVTGEVTGRPIPVVRNPPRNEPRVLISDHTKIGDELGWSPERSALREIVADAWGAVSRT